jgi:hypothetical protein
MQMTDWPNCRVSNIRRFAVTAGLRNILPAVQRSLLEERVSMWPAACGLGNVYDRGGSVKGSEGGGKVTEQGGWDVDRIEKLSSVLMVEVARPLQQRVESLCSKRHGVP